MFVSPQKTHVGIHIPKLVVFGVKPLGGYKGGAITFGICAFIKEVSQRP